MPKKSPFRYFKPYFFGGLFDDPVLVIRVRSLAQNILIDCGKINHLAKRVLKSVSAVFITHAHMDHFMGFDTFVRSVLVSPKTIDVFGPPSMATKLEYKLLGYDWNLVEKHYCNFRVHEVYPEHTDIFQLQGSKGFTRAHVERHSRLDNTIFNNSHMTVEAEICDHIIPVLVFKFTERAGFTIDEDKIEQLGFVKGPWLKELEAYFYNKNKQDSQVLKIPKKSESGAKDFSYENPEILYANIQKERPLVSIGYMSDFGFTDQNIQKILNLMKGVTLLVSECTYLNSESEKAKQTLHLCTDDLNVLVGKLAPPYFLPMHLSTTYLQDYQKLYSELQPPEGCTVFQLPPRLTPQPIFPEQLPDLFSNAK